MALRLAMIVAVVACGGNSPSTVPDGNSPSTIQDGLELRLELDAARLEAGQPLGLKLVVGNPSQGPVTVVFPTACEENFVVRRGAEPVWELASGRMCAQVMSERTLEPGDTLTYQATWNQEDDDGTAVPAGEYVVVGELLSRPPRSTPAETFVIRRDGPEEEIGSQ